MSRSFLVAILVCGAFLCGCSKKEPESEVPQVSAQRKHAEVKLTVLVVEDSELAEAVKLLRGEWAERSGGSLIVQQTSRSALLEAEQPEADLIIYPTTLMAELVAKEWLRPVRESVLNSENFSLNDVLPLVRNEVMRYGGQVVGVSLGEAPLMLARQNDSVQAGDESVGASWQKLAGSQSLAADDTELVAEFIARAAAATDPRQRDELLFTPDSMAPRLTSPAMLRALQQMGSGKPDDQAASAYRVVNPTRALLSQNETSVLSALPRAEQTYDLLRDKWDKPLGKGRLSILGFSGRMASVTRSTRNATSAFKLLEWLTSGQAATQVSSRSLHTVWFRNSQSRRSERWLQQPGADRIASVITELLAAEEHFLLPRISGLDSYLEILSKAIKEAREAKLEPLETLQSVTEQWEALTNQLGREQQKRSYRYHLGLDNWSN